MVCILKDVGPAGRSQSDHAWPMNRKPVNALSIGDSVEIDLTLKW